MLVPVQALHCVVFLYPKSLQIAQNFWLNRNLILANYETLILTNWLVDLEPGMFTNLLTGDSLVWVSLQNTIQQVSTVFRKLVG